MAFPFGFFVTLRARLQGLRVMIWIKRRDQGNAGWTTCISWISWVRKTCKMLEFSPKAFSKMRLAGIEPAGGLAMRVRLESEILTLTLPLTLTLTLIGRLESGVR